MGMSPDVDKARAAMKRGASLEEAAVAGGFESAAVLDQALWQAMPPDGPAQPDPKRQAQSERARRVWASRGYRESRRAMQEARLDLWLSHR